MNKQNNGSVTNSFFQQEKKGLISPLLKPMNYTLGSLASISAEDKYEYVKKSPVESPKEKKVAKSSFFARAKVIDDDDDDEASESNNPP